MRTQREGENVSKSGYGAHGQCLRSTARFWFSSVYMPLANFTRQLHKLELHVCAHQSSTPPCYHIPSLATRDNETNAASTEFGRLAGAAFVLQQPPQLQTLLRKGTAQAVDS